MIKSHPSGQNFFMVVVRFLETFVGSMSAGWFINLTRCSLYAVFTGFKDDYPHRLSYSLPTPPNFRVT